MSQKEENIDVNLYIDELKSDDPMLKLNAISKLGIVASNLSQSRVEDEFIPYLTFIITELDNEDEFLLKLSENLYTFLKENQHITKTKAIRLYEPMAALEDSQIRQSAVKGLLLIAEDDKNEVLQTIYRLVNYSMISKVSALEIIGGLLKIDSIDFILLKECEKIVFVLMNDNALPVRRNSIRALNVFWLQHTKFSKGTAKGQDLKAYSRAFVLDFLKTYDQSTNESVLFEALNESLVISLSSLLEEKSLEILVDSFLRLLNSKEVSWRTKFMVLSNHYVFVHIHAKIPAVIETFKKLFKEEDQEVRSAVVRALGNLFESIDSAKSIEIIWGLVKEFVQVDLASEKNQYVKESFVDLLRQMLTNGSRDVVVQKVAIELFDSNFSDFSADTKLRSLDFIESFLCNEYVHGGDQMFERLEQFSTDKNWRLKLSLLEKMEIVIKTLLETSGKVVLLNKVLDLCLKFKDDLVFAVRSKVLDNMILISTQGSTKKKLSDSIKEVILGWIGNRNYIFRVSGLQALPNILKSFEKEGFDQLVKQVYDILKAESVPNVRINMLKTLIRVKESIKSQTWTELSRRLQSEWESDNDRDVKTLITELSQIAA
jgi:serine/threonine-protein phosphatase 2A regulatory subunit A